MSIEGRSSQHTTTKNLVWVAFFVLVVPLVAYNLYIGLTVGKIGLPGGISLEFKDKKSLIDTGKFAELSDGERSKGQVDLEKRLGDMEARLHDQEQREGPPKYQFQKANSVSEETSVRKFDINGTWQAAGGISYVVRQNGDAVTIQEVSPIYGITAAGEGVIKQQDITVSYVTALYTTGRGILRVSDDGHQITGMFTDLSTGVSIPAALFR